MRQHSLTANAHLLLRAPCLMGYGSKIFSPVSRYDVTRSSGIGWLTIVSAKSLWPWQYQFDHCKINNQFHHSNIIFITWLEWRHVSSQGAVGVYPIWLITVLLKMLCANCGQFTLPLGGNFCVQCGKYMFLFSYMCTKCKFDFFPGKFSNHVHGYRKCAFRRKGQVEKITIE